MREYGGITRCAMEQDLIRYVEGELGDEVAEPYNGAEPYLRWKSTWRGCAEGWT